MDTASTLPVESMATTAENMATMTEKMAAVMADNTATKSDIHNMTTKSNTHVSAFDMAVAKSQATAFDPDRTLLAEIYGQANSVFEYGLGESTYIANHVGVARYAGIDSDAGWVANARKSVSTHFRFYFADIGETLLWGNPAQELPKSVLDYQVLPLISEPEPFDVYMVDGRWRLACLLLSFLHASARGADHSQTTVLLHDCIQKHRTPSLKRQQYLKADHLLDLVRHSGDKLCVYRRKPTTTDEELYDLWLQNFDEVV